MEDFVKEGLKTMRAWFGDAFTDAVFGDSVAEAEAEAEAEDTADRLQRNKQLAADIARAVLNEEGFAYKTFGQYHSVHEAWAVIAEEIDEVGDCWDPMKDELENLWSVAKNRNSRDNAERVLGIATRIKEHAMNLAAEAIQVAATARKLEDWAELRMDDEEDD